MNGTDRAFVVHGVIKNRIKTILLPGVPTIAATAAGAIAYIANMNFARDAA